MAWRLCVDWGVEVRHGQAVHQIAAVFPFGNPGKGERRFGTDAFGIFLVHQIGSDAVYRNGVALERGRTEFELIAKMPINVFDPINKGLRLKGQDRLHQTCRCGGCQQGRADSSGDPHAHLTNVCCAFAKRRDGYGERSSNPLR